MKVNVFNLLISTPNACV